MVAFLEKSTGSEGFHQVIDFLNRSHICYALTKKPDVYISFIKQFWDGMLESYKDVIGVAGTERKRARVVLSEDNEDVKDDSSKHGRKLSDARGTASEVPVVSTTAGVNISTAGRTVNL
ncbi:hypothetical protein Tco_0496751 [Tanacetum coccineum]